MSTELVAVPTHQDQDGGLTAMILRASSRLAEAATLDEVRGAKNAFELAREYAKKVGASLEAQADILRGIVGAERRLADEIDAAQDRGEIAREHQAGGRPRQDGKPIRGQEQFVYLKELGLNGRHVYEWRRMRDAGDRALERAIERAIRERRPPTKADVLREAKKSERAARREAEEAATDDTCTVADLYDLIRDGRTFGTIYVDPPWRYDNQATRAATGNHYKAGEENPESGMTVEQICSLPVRELAAKDAHLHLWTTNGFLFECPRIFEAWGFEFRSSFVWVKSTMGIGNYWRNSHEFLLTAIRGDAKRFNDHGLMSWMESKRGKHSAKPEQVRAMLESASPGPRLELFGRAKAKGWSVWGNEVAPDALYQDYIKNVA